MSGALRSACVVAATQPPRPSQPRLVLRSVRPARQLLASPWGSGTDERPVARASFAVALEETSSFFRKNLRGILYAAGGAWLFGGWLYSRTGEVPTMEFPTLRPSAYASKPRQPDAAHRLNTKTWVTTIGFLSLIRLLIAALTSKR